MTKSDVPLSQDLVRHELEKTRSTLPIFNLVPELLTDAKMFKSFGRFERAGFKLVAHAETKMMTGSHKSANGYLFKKYNNDHSDDDQLRNYMHRIEGVNLLRSFIAERGFTQVTAPKKWLYELPTIFEKRYLLVVEKVDIASHLKTVAAYAHISDEQLQELATVLFYFRGLNSTAANLPFTKSDKIAFIDTERWHHDKDLLKHVGSLLSSSRREQARRIFKKLKKQGAKPLVSGFR